MPLRLTGRGSNNIDEDFYRDELKFNRPNQMNVRLFTKWEPDAAGQMLGTGFYRFASKFGVDGLAKENGDRLDILAVESKQEGRGCFRNFIAACKSEYKTVCVWFCDNPVAASSLQRYGFSAEVEVDGRGETLEGFRWDKT